MAECAIVIFGAHGDLAKRKLLPALYRLAYERRLPATASIIGTSRTPLIDDSFRAKMHDSVKEFLVNHGVDPARIATVSYGKERPIDPGTGEAAWSHDRNARTDITSGAG